MTHPHHSMTERRVERKREKEEELKGRSKKIDEEERGSKGMKKEKAKEGGTQRIQGTWSLFLKY